MRAALALEAGDRVDIMDVLVRDPLDDEVLVRVSACGICHSDLTQIRGERAGLKFPLVVGHEAAGVVEAIGARVSRVKVGDRVMLSGIPACGRCYFCARGLTVYCVEMVAAAQRPPKYRYPDGSPVYHYGIGAFSEMTVISELAVIPVEDDVPDYQLALLGCAVTTGLGAVFNVAQVEPGDSVLVIGAGGVGQSIVQGARIAGAGEIVVSDPAESKHLLAQRNGATTTTTASGAELIELCRSLTGGRGVDHAFDAVGQSALIETCYSATRSAGKIIAVGLPGPDMRFDLPGYQFLVTGRSLHGCLYGGGNLLRDTRRYIDLLTSGALDIGSLVSSALSLDQIQQGFSDMIDGTAIRGVVDLAL